MKFDKIGLLVGNTPCLRIYPPQANRCRFWIKLEGQNPTGSVKDRACVANLAAAVSAGRLIPGMTILDASSGNMACSLAYFGRVMGFAVTVVCSSKLTKDKANFIQLFGGELIMRGHFTIEGNELCRDMAAKANGKYCFIDQLHNSANPGAHYEGTGREILSDFPQPAAVVGSLGSGGTMLGVAQRLREEAPSTLIVGVEAATGTRLPGVGAFDDGDYVTPFIAEAKKRRLFDEVVKVTYVDAIRSTEEARNQGLYAGLQTGGVMAAAVRVATERNLDGDVIVISGDSGWKNMDKLMSPAVDVS